jgi:hypothetical protein
MVAYCGLVIHMESRSRIISVMIHAVQATVMWEGPFLTALGMNGIIKVY